MPYEGIHPELQKLCSETYDVAVKKTTFLTELDQTSGVLYSAPLANPAYGEGFRVAASKLQPALYFWTVRLVSGAGGVELHFSDEAAVRKTASDHQARMAARRTNPTPEKVLVKMVSLRFRKVRTRAREVQERVDQQRKNPSWGAVTDIPQPDFRALVTRASVVEFLRALKAHQFVGQYCNVTKEALELFEGRDDVTDRIVAAAADLAMVEEVMES